MKFVEHKELYVSSTDPDQDMLCPHGDQTIMDIHSFIPIKKTRWHLPLRTFTQMEQLMSLPLRSVIVAASKWTLGFGRRTCCKSRCLRVQCWPAGSINKWSLFNSHYQCTSFAQLCPEPISAYPFQCIQSCFQRVQSSFCVLPSSIPHLRFQYHIRPTESC